MFKTVEQIMSEPEMRTQREVLCDRLDTLIDEVMDAVCQNGRGITGSETRQLCDITHGLDMVKCGIAKSILEWREYGD